MHRSFYILSLLAVLSLIHSHKRISNGIERNLKKKKEETRISLPPRFSNLVDVKEYFDPNFDRTQARITPFYWHIAKAAGTTVHTFYSHCYNLIEASEIGGFAANDKIEIVKRNSVTNHVNVDTSSLPGIAHAKEVGLVQSQVAQLIISPLFHDAMTELFSQDDRGVMFAMFRHPIKRVISLFYYLQNSTWELTYNPIFANMTIEEYADSPLIESNFITRSLINKMEGPLSIEEVELAKEVLRRKCIIGLVDEFETSIDMFNNAFGFRPNFSVEVDEEDGADNSTKQARVDGCVESLKSKGGSNTHKHPKLSETSKAYETIERKNSWDLELWDLIVSLYHEQRLTVVEQKMGFKGFERSA